MFFLFLQIEHPLSQNSYVFTLLCFVDAILSCSCFFPVSTFLKTCESERP
jgi:hypothetical protein